MLFANNKRFHLRVYPKWKKTLRFDDELDWNDCPPPQSQPRYKVWAGNHSFLLWGRLMMGSHPHYLLLSFSMISVTWLIYYLVVAPFLHSEFFYLAGIALWTSNIVFLFLTAFVEPGIQPRRQQSGRHSSFSYLTSNENSEVAADSLSLEGSVLKQNYCKICSIVRNERTKHCRYCNVCVAVLDHHCPWTGNCIGIRNYPQFYCFVLSVFLAALLLLYGALLLLLGIVFDVPCDYPHLRLLSVVLLLPWGLLVLLPVGLLLGFHSYLICIGSTTGEFLRARMERRVHDAAVTSRSGSTHSSVRSSSSGEPATPLPPSSTTSSSGAISESSAEPASAEASYLGPEQEPQIGAASGGNSGVDTGGGCTGGGTGGVTDGGACALSSSTIPAALLTVPAAKSNISNDSASASAALPTTLAISSSGRTTSAIPQPIIACRTSISDTPSKGAEKEARRDICDSMTGVQGKIDVGKAMDCHSEHVDIQHSVRGDVAVRTASNSGWTPYSSNNDTTTTPHSSNGSTPLSYTDSSPTLGAYISLSNNDPMITRHATKSSPRNTSEIIREAGYSNAVSPLTTSGSLGTMRLLDPADSGSTESTLPSRSGSSGGVTSHGFACHGEDCCGLGCCDCGRASVAASTVGSSTPTAALLMLALLCCCSEQLHCDPNCKRKCAGGGGGAAAGDSSSRGGGGGRGAGRRGRDGGTLPNQQEQRANSYQYWLGLVPRIPGTKLLPLWQFEGLEDAYVQQQLGHDLFKRIQLEWDRLSGSSGSACSGGADSGGADSTGYSSSSFGSSRRRSNALRGGTNSNNGILLSVGSTELGGQPLDHAQTHAQHVHTRKKHVRKATIHTRGAQARLFEELTTADSPATSPVNRIGENNNDSSGASPSAADESAGGRGGDAGVAGKGRRRAKTRATSPRFPRVHGLDEGLPGVTSSPDSGSPWSGDNLSPFLEDRITV